MNDNRQTDDGEVKDAVSGLHSGLVGVLSAGVVIARYCWNMQMRGLRAIGFMPIFIRFPWLFFVAGFLLLAVLYPVGMVFLITALAAGMGGDSPSARNEFIVSVKGDRDHY